MDHAALAGREGLGRVHRIDQREGTVCAEIPAACVHRAERGRGIDHHRAAMAARKPGIAIEIEHAAEGRIRHDRGDMAVMRLEQPLLVGWIGLPGIGIDVAQQRRQPGADRRMRGGGEGEGGHQRHRARPRHAAERMDQRGGQTDCRVRHAERCAAAAEQGVGDRRLEALQHRAVVAEDAGCLDRGEFGAELAQPRRVRADQLDAHLSPRPRERSDGRPPAPPLSVHPLSAGNTNEDFPARVAPVRRATPPPPHPMARANRRAG